MFVGTRGLAATAVACTVVLGGSLIYSAQAEPDASTCGQAVALAEQMAEVNGKFIGTMGARSAALRLGMDDKVAELTPKMEALRTEYQSLHAQMRAAGAGC